MCRGAVEETKEKMTEQWNKVSDEVGMGVAVLRSGASQRLNETALTAVCDAIAKGDVMKLLNNLEAAGLGEHHAAVEELGRLDEVLVVWRCLETAIVEDDRMGLETWLELAGQLTGLAMPPEVEMLMEQMRDRERRVLKQHERQQEVYRRIGVALEARDRQMLNDILEVCLREQLDATPVRLAMQQIAGGQASPQ